MKTIRMFCLAAFVLAGSSSAFSKDAPGPTEFAGGIRIPSNLGFSVTPSPDKQVITVIFDNLLQELEPAGKSAAGVSNQTASRTKAFTMLVPYETSMRSVKMIMDVRGFVSADNDDDVKLVVHAGNATKVVSLFASDKVGNAPDVKLKGKTKAALIAEGKLDTGRSGDFYERIEFTVQVRAERPAVPITLFLLTEHDTAVAGAGGALLAVDSIDLSFGKPGDGKYRK